MPSFGRLVRQSTQLVCQAHPRPMHRYQSYRQTGNAGSSHVTRVVYPAFLNPGIIQKILRGAHPPEISAARLVRMVPLPESREMQQKLLGMIS